MQQIPVSLTEELRLDEIIVAMRSRHLLATIIALSAPTLSYAKDQHYIAGSTLVEFVGHSGQLRFCKLDDGSNTCGGRFVQIKMGRLREIDIMGGMTKNKVSSFASTDFTWSQPEETEIFSDNLPSTLRGTRVCFTTQLRVGSNSPSAPKANFTMDTVTYHTDGTAQNGNVTIFVPEGALKFSIEVNGWPFLNKNNFLQFGVDIQTNQNAGRNFGLHSANGTSDQDEFYVGDGITIDAPTSAMIDGSQQNIEATLTVEPDRQSIDWTFPFFESSLFYDPVIRASEILPNSSGDKKSFPHAVATILSAFAVSLL
ncbi:hypothetical protein ACHAWX_006212 [Stephanocyclus meneghinianus]